MSKTCLSLDQLHTLSPHTAVLLWKGRWEQLKPALTRAKHPAAKPTLKLVCTKECQANEDMGFLMKTLRFMLCSVTEWDLIKSTFSRMHHCIIGNCARLALRCKRAGKKWHCCLGGACLVLVCSACTSVLFIFRCTELTKEEIPRIFDVNALWCCFLGDGIP